MVECSFSKRIKTGDRGQRYEIRYTDKDDGKEKVIGWSDDPDNLVECINLHPSMEDPKVIDRLEEKRNV